MLAMMLRANRPVRNTRGIRLLLTLCDIRTIEDAEELDNEFYPGDLLTERQRAWSPPSSKATPRPAPWPIEI